MGVGTPIWDPDLGPRFGTPKLGTPFGAKKDPEIGDPDLGRWGTAIWGNKGSRTWGPRN
jgi:hypothetical protein